MGDASTTGGPFGDLYVHVRVKPHPIFERNDIDLYCDVPITFATAVAGGEIEVPTLTGKKKVKIVAGTQTGKMMKLSGEGMKSLRGNYRGDLLIRLNIETPTNLSKHQMRSEEHTSELQSRQYLVCRLLLEKKKKKYSRDAIYIDA